MEFCGEFTENVRRMDALLRVRESFDLIKKEMVIGRHRAVFYYVDGFVESASMNKLMIYLLSLAELAPREIPAGKIGRAHV